MDGEPLGAQATVFHLGPVEWGGHRGAPASGVRGYAVWG